MIKEQVVECPTCKGWGGNGYSSCGACGGGGAVIRLAGIPNGRVEHIPYSSGGANTNLRGMHA